MNYSQIYFGKDREQLTYDDIVQYFETPKEENDSIEFKSFHATSDIKDSYNKLCITISAFLNSGGGILIWGAPIGVPDPNNKKKRIFQGALTPINILLEKDSLISRVSLRISPVPNGINVKIIPEKGSYICVFEIQKGITAYQMQGSGTYDMRLDGQNHPAPSHYVEALIKQIRYPELGGYLCLNGLTKVKFGYDDYNYELSFTVVLCNWSEFQNEKNVNHRLITNIGMFSGHKGRSVASLNPNPILHFGANIFTSYVIEFKKEEVENGSFPMKLELYFGGETSPMKVSQYIIDLRVLQPGETIKNLLQNTIYDILVSSLPQHTVSKEEKIKRIEGRKFSS